MNEPPRVVVDFAARLGSWVLDTPRWKLVTVLFTLMFFRTGVTFVAPVLVPIARNPYRNPFANPYEHYLYWSWLGPFLAHQVGATEAPTLTLFYLVFAVSFSILMVRWFFTVLDDHLARVALLVFALLPASAVPYYWIFNDSLTLFLLACALYFPRNWLVVGLLGAGLGMQHFEQGLVASAAALLALTWAARRGASVSYDWRWALALLAGTVAGRILLSLIFVHLEVQVNSGRLFWLRGGWAVMLRRFAYSYHFALFSAFGVGWLVLIPFLRRKSAEALPTGAVLLGLLLLMPVSDDPTRVFAIVSFPLVCVLLLRNAEFLATISRETIGLLAFLWCLIPWMFVWSGKPLVSAAAYDLFALFHHLLGSSSGPGDPRFPP